MEKKTLNYFHQKTKKQKQLKTKKKEHKNIKNIITYHIFQNN